MSAINSRIAVNLLEGDFERSGSLLYKWQNTNRGSVDAHDAHVLERLGFTIGTYFVVFSYFAYCFSLLLICICASRGVAEKLEVTYGISRKKGFFRRQKEENKVIFIRTSLLVQHSHDGIPRQCGWNRGSLQVEGYLQLKQHRYVPSPYLTFIYCSWAANALQTF